MLHGRWWWWHRSNRDFLGGCHGSCTHGCLHSSSTPRTRRCCCCLPTLLLTYFYAPLFFWSTLPFNVSTYGFSLCLFLIHHWWIHLFIKDLCLIVPMLSLFSLFFLLLLTLFVLFWSSLLVWDEPCYLYIFCGRKSVRIHLWKGAPKGSKVGNAKKMPLSWMKGSGSQLPFSELIVIDQNLKSAHG